MKNNLVLSNLNHTWILDLDGTILKHNGYKIDGKDTLLDNAKKFIDNIPNDDFIIIITSREIKYKDITEEFLNQNNIRFNHIIYNVPFGERILINDKKTTGLETAVAINLNRDKADFPNMSIDEKL